MSPPHLQPTNCLWPGRSFEAVGTVVERFRPGLCGAAAAAAGPVKARPDEAMRAGPDYGCATNLIGRSWLGFSQMSLNPPQSRPNFSRASALSTVESAALIVMSSAPSESSFGAEIARGAGHHDQRRR